MNLIYRISVPNVNIVSLTVLMDGLFGGLTSFSTAFQSYQDEMEGGTHEGLCAMQCHLSLDRISPPAGVEPETL